LVDGGGGGSIGARRNSSKPARVVRDIQSRRHPSLPREHRGDTSCTLVDPYRSSILAAFVPFFPGQRRVRRRLVLPSFSPFSSVSSESTTARSHHNAMLQHRSGFAACPPFLFARRDEERVLFGRLKRDIRVGHLGGAIRLGSLCSPPF